MTGLRRMAIAAALAAAMSLAFAPASRADSGNSGSFGGLKLVWGSVPMPDYGSRFGLPTSIADGVAVDTPGSSVALTLPDNQGETFLFSPRLPQVMPEAHGGAGSRPYLGFSFDIGESTGLYGSLAVGGSVAPQHVPGMDDGGPRSLSAPLMLHGGVEFGYRLDSQNTFSLSIDRATPPDPLDRSSAIGNFRLQYGLKF